MIEEEIEQSPVVEADAAGATDDQMVDDQATDNQAVDDVKPKRKGIDYLKRLPLAFLASLFTVVTVCLVAPLEIVAGNSDLLFTPSEIWQPLALAAAVITVMLALALSLFRGRAFQIALVIVFVLGLCCYVQALCLNVKLPATDGAVVAVDWSGFTTITLVTGAVWLVLILGFIFLGLKKPGISGVVVCTLSIALLVIQVAGMAKLFVENDGGKTVQSGEQTRLYQLEDGLFSVSEKSNVIVFVLDTFDTAYLNRVLANDPTVLDGYTGFTYFENSVGSMIPTRYGVPYLLTGVYPQVGESYASWRNQRYYKSTMLQDIDAAGYSIGLYSDSLKMPDEVKTLAMNIHPLDNRDTNTQGILVPLYRCALYRDMPWVLKSCFWYSDDEINDAVTTLKDPDDDSLVPYTMDDPRFFQQLWGRGLAADDESEGAFRFIHLEGAHPPFNMDAQGNAVEKTTEMEQEKGSLYLVSYYLNQLKELGVYNDSTIIVTADHGDWFLINGPLYTPTSPMLLVKPAGQTEEEMNAPVQVSHVPTGHVDVPGTIMKAILGDASSYGDTVFDIREGSRSRLYYETTSDGTRDTSLIEWSVDGEVLDFSSWHLTGNVWTIYAEDKPLENNTEKPPANFDEIVSSL